MKLKDACSLEEKYDQPRQHIKKQRHYFVNKGLSSQGYVFPVVMYGCESWTIKKAEHWRIDAFEMWCWRTLLRVIWTANRWNKSILKDISPEYPLERLIDAEDEAPILWPPDANNWLIGKVPDSGKDWKQEEKGMTEDEMIGWHHQLDGHGFGWTPGVGDGQGGLACCSPWGHKESDMTEWLNWAELEVNNKCSRQICPRSTEWSRAKGNRVLPKERTVHNTLFPYTTLFRSPGVGDG